jgi:flagellar basal-body rod protein FlgB
MSLHDMTLFRLMQGKMDYMSSRQTVLGQNIANADTPDYKARDLKPFNFKAILEETRRVRPVLTSPAHQTGSRIEDGVGGRAERSRNVYETQVDGNSVNLEEQMYKVTQVTQEYNEVLELYGKQMRMLKTALGRGGGG